MEQQATTRDPGLVPAAVFYNVVSIAHLLAAFAALGFAFLALFGAIDAVGVWGYTAAAAAVVLAPLEWVAAHWFARYRPPLEGPPPLSDRERTLAWANVLATPIVLVAVAYIDVGAALLLAAGAGVSVFVGTLCVLRRNTWAAFVPLAYLILGRTTN